LGAFHRAHAGFDELRPLHSQASQPFASAGHGVAKTATPWPCAFVRAFARVFGRGGPSFRNDDDKVNT